MVKRINPDQNKPVVFIACRVFETLLESLLPEHYRGGVVYLDYGLHVFPKKLTIELQAQIDRIDQPSLVVLTYGLCGNGLVGLRSGGHTVVVPRTDDCIAILLGSNEHYHEVFNSEPGTYYLTKGWLEAGSNPLQEYQGYVEKYGVEKADMVMDYQYQNYSRLMFVAHSQDDLHQYREQVDAIARYCQRWDMRYEERLGSDQYIRNLVDFVSILQENGKGDFPHPLGEDFVVLPPNSILEQRMFLG